MTPQELAALPVGTRVQFDLRVDESDAPVFDYGTVRASGGTCAIEWDAQDGSPPVTGYIDTKSISWARFIKDIGIKNNS